MKTHATKAVYRTAIEMVYLIVGGQLRAFSLSIRMIDVPRGRCGAQEYRSHLKQNWGSSLWVISSENEVA